MTIDERVGIAFVPAISLTDWCGSGINGLSSLILELFANERGAHSRSA